MLCLAGARGIAPPCAVATSCRACSNARSLRQQAVADRGTISRNSFKEKRLADANRFSLAGARGIEPRS